MILRMKVGGFEDEGGFEVILRMKVGDLEDEGW